MTCDDAADLIDLYAASECAPPEARAVRAHLDGCASCREALAQARRLQALLDQRFRQDAALARLTARLKADVRPPPAARTLPFARRFAAVAALLLVTFGLGLWLSPPRASAPPLQLTLATGLDRGPEAVPARGKLEKAVVLEDAAPVMAEAVRKAKAEGDWPLPPRVGVWLTVTNPGPAAVELDVGGPDFRCVLDLRGPGVHAEPVADPAFVPFRRRAVVIAPGGSLTLRVERLASQRGGQVSYLYPTGKGDYSLRVRLEAAAWSGGRQRRVALTSGRVVLRVR